MNKIEQITVDDVVYDVHDAELAKEASKNLRTVDKERWASDEISEALIAKTIPSTAFTETAGSVGSISKSSGTGYAYDYDTLFNRVYVDRSNNRGQYSKYVLSTWPYAIPNPDFDSWDITKDDSGNITKMELKPGNYMDSIPQRRYDGHILVPNTVEEYEAEHDRNGTVIKENVRKMFAASKGYVDAKIAEINSATPLGDFTYTEVVFGGVEGYSIAGRGTVVGDTLVLPDFYNGKPVLSVESHAFESDTATKIVFGKYIVHIGEFNLAAMPNLKDIRFTTVVDELFLKAAEITDKGIRIHYAVTEPYSDTMFCKIADVNSDGNVEPFDISSNYYGDFQSACDALGELEPFYYVFVTTEAN